MNNLAIATVGGVALIAAGCSAELDTARDMGNTGTEFQRALYNGYLDLAQAEFDENDFEDARFFARRAQLAARGVEVLPQAIRHRRLSPDMAGEMSQSREQLLQALENGARSKAPREAAIAQLGFDCWLQEAEENIQPAEIANCRKRFQTALSGLGVSRPPKKTAGVPSPSPVSDRTATRLPLTAAAPPTGRSFTVLFRHNSVKLTPEGRRTVRAAARSVRDQGAIIVSGHADRSGPAAYNLKLSDRRARAVANALMADRTLKAGVETHAFGEGRPAIATEDGEREPRNRRVEIQFREALARTASRE